MAESKDKREFVPPNPPLRREDEVVDFTPSVAEGYPAADETDESDESKD